MAKILSVLLALMMLFGSVAYAESSDDAARAIVAGDQALGSVGTDEDGPFGRYVDPITVTFVKSTDSTSDSRMALLTEAYGETWADNRWTRAFKEELNIDVKYLWICDNSQYDQKWKMAMASGDLPDMMLVGQTDLNQLAEAGMIQPLGEYWDFYASDLNKDIIKDAGGQSMYDAAKAMNGELYGLPISRAALDYYCYLYVRTDWLEKLNLEWPTTTDGLWDVWTAFCTQDPDGNGVDDTYAFCIDKSLWFKGEGLFWSFGAYPDTWLPDGNGELVYGATLNEMKAPIQFLADAYAAGYIDPEFAVKDNDTACEIVAAGKCGMSSGGHWITSTQILNAVQLDDTAQWGCLEWPSLTGEPVVSELELGMGSAMAVNSEYRNPEAAVKMLNLFYEKLYGETGDYGWYGNDEGTGSEGVWTFGPLSGYHPLINVIPYRDAKDVIDGVKTVEDLQGASLNYWNNCHQEDKYLAWSWSKMWLPYNQSAGDHINNILINEPDRLFTDYFIGAPTPTMVERWSTIWDMTNATVIKMITGELSVENDWDTFVQSWYAMGGDKITEEVNEWYKSVQG